MSEQIRNLKKPNKILLIFTLIGTSLLALSSAFGTLALIAGISNDEYEKLVSVGLLVVSILGFALFFGYIWTVIKQKYIPTFWFCSTVYNLFLACFYGYTIIIRFKNTGNLWEGSSDFFIDPFFLLAWTIFVTTASINYIFYGLRVKRTSFDAVSVNRNGRY